jgi:hypothetical protein
MRKFTILLLVICPVLLYAQKGKTYQNLWYEEGKDEMLISSENFSYSGKSGFYYLILNNNNNLCLDLRVEDRPIQNRMLTDGMTVWVDMDGKLARKLVIRFPLGSAHSGSTGSRKMAATEPVPEANQVSPIELANTIELKGFTGENSIRFPSDNNDTFRGNLKYDNKGILHYILILPVAKLPLRNSKDMQGAVLFNIGIEYGASGSGTSATGGSRGGRKSDDRGQFRNAEPSKGKEHADIFWIKNIKLASNK